MKTNQKYFALSLISFLTVMGASVGTVGFAQTITPVSCSVASSTVNVNQAAIFTATGGNGTYVWSGNNLNITNSAGNQFAVSYPNPGTYAITVTSAGQSATCNMTVAVSATSGNLVCSPSTQNVTLGQTVTVSASGGSGTYTWSSPDLSISNPNGSGFSASYASTGPKVLTLTSAGLVATCAVNVLSSVVTPGFPNTGGGFGE